MQSSILMNAIILETFICNLNLNPFLKPNLIKKAHESRLPSKTI